MGYTHYFTRQREITNEEWDLIRNATLKVLERCEMDGIALAYEYDYPKAKPEITGTMIRFNGVGEEGHETFLVDRMDHGGFGFCKTAEKPYDVAVTGILAIMNHYAPGGWDIGSDGDCSDWELGLELATLAVRDAELEAGLVPTVECPLRTEDEVA